MSHHFPAPRFPSLPPTPLFGGTSPSSPLWRAYVDFDRTPTLATLQRICFLVYRDLTGTLPTARLAISEGLLQNNEQLLGLYSMCTHTCTVRRLYPQRLMITVMCHELGHAMRRRWLPLRSEEARVELFEMACARHLEEQLSLTFSIPLADTSLLYARRDWLGALPSTALMSLYQDFDHRYPELGISRWERWFALE